MAIKKNQVIFDENLEIESQDTTSIQQYSSLQNFFRGIAPYATDWIPYVIFNATNENQNVGIPAEYLTMDFVETVTHNGETYYAYERDFPKAIVGSSRATKVTVELGFFASQEDLIGVKLYDETVEGYNDTTYIASQLLVDFPNATDGQIVRVFNTDSDWVYNSGTSSWIDSVSKIATELQEHRSVPVEYALIGGKSTTPPTHAPTNTQIIIDQLNEKINRTEVTNNFFDRTQSDERFYNISGDTLEGDVNANSHSILNVSNITPTSITFDTDKVLSWSDTNGTLELTLSDGVTVQLGQENLVYVRNTSGVLLTEGQPVRLSGTLGNRPEAFPVDIANDTHAQTTIGLVTSSGGIANNAFGHVATFGLVRELDTSAYAVGDILWVNPSGGLTNNRADIVAPNNVIKIGYVVTSSATNGVIFVCLDRLQKLNELSDIFGTPSDEDIVMYDSVNGRFFYFDLKGYVDTRVEDLVKLASYNSVNGVLTFTRDNDTTFTIDLPLEQLIVSGEYDEINKDLILTLDNGSTITIPVDDIFVGLATQTWVNTQLENYYTQAQVDTIAQAKIDLDLGNPEIGTITDMVSTDLLYVYRVSDGTYKRISWSAILGDITTETGSFAPTATYPDLTAGFALELLGGTPQPLTTSDIIDSTFGVFEPKEGIPTIQEIKGRTDGINKIAYVNKTIDEVVYENKALSDIYAEDNTVVKNATSWQPANELTNTILFQKNLSASLNYEIPTVNSEVSNIYLRIGNFIVPVTSANDNFNTDSESVSINISSLLGIRILKSKLTGITSADFEAYLQANEVEFIYEQDITYTTPPTELQLDDWLTSYLARKDITKKVLTYKDVFETFQDVINGDFDNGDANWIVYSTPDAITITDKMIFNGTPLNQAGYYQDIVANIENELYIGFSASNAGEDFPNVRVSQYGSFSGSVTTILDENNQSIITNSKIGGIRLYFQQSVLHTYDNAIIDNVILLNLKHFDEQITKEQLDTFRDYYLEHQAYSLNNLSNFELKTTNEDETISQTQRFIFDRLSDLPNNIADTITPNETNDKYILNRNIGVIENVAIGATINDTTISDIKLTSTFMAFDFVNGETQYGDYGDTLTLTGTSTVYYELDTPTTSEIDVDGVLLSDSVTTLEQLQTLPTTYTINFDLDVGGTVKTLVGRDSKQQDEIDDNEARHDSYNQGQQEDMRFSATQLKVGATVKPDFDFTNIALAFPQNDETEIVYGAGVMSHQRIAGTDIQPHLHFKQTSAGTPVFVLEYKWYNPHEQVPTSFTTLLLDTTTDTWTTGTLSNILYNGTNSFIDGTGKGEASIFEFRLYRQTGDGVTGDVLVTEFDVHFYASRFGKDVL